MTKTERVVRLADDSIAVITWEGYDPTELDLPSRVGRQFVPVDRSLLVPSTVPFRLRDEDGEVHYRGVVRDDPDCECQSILSDWGAADTGGFIIEVRRNGEWVMEIA